MICGLFLTCYGFFRIALENVREPDRDMPHFPFGLTMGIMLSVPMVLAGLALIAYARRPSSLAIGAADGPALEATPTSNAHGPGTPA
jgi:phosphatidylglycerol:prolipoprotein diacylglycerol transferase